MCRHWSNVRMLFGMFYKKVLLPEPFNLKKGYIFNDLQLKMYYLSHIYDHYQNSFFYQLK